MAELIMAHSSFDLIWSEGAPYKIGIQRELSIFAGLLRKGGYLVFTDAVGVELIRQMRSKPFLRVTTQQWAQLQILSH